MSTGCIFGCSYSLPQNRPPSDARHGERVHERGSDTAERAASPVRRAGRVLLYAAEDALHIVRRRLEGICATTSLSLADLPGRTPQVPDQP